MHIDKVCVWVIIINKSWWVWGHWHDRNWKERGKEKNNAGTVLSFDVFRNYL